MLRYFRNYGWVIWLTGWMIWVMDIKMFSAKALLFFIPLLFLEAWGKVYLIKQLRKVIQ